MRRAERAAARLGALVLVVAAAGPAVAAAGDSLGERRLGVIKGTAPGIVLIDRAPPLPPPAVGAASTPAAVPAAAAAAGSVPTATAAGTPVADAARIPGVLRGLPPPSGRALDRARKLDAPDQGIPLPTRAGASR